MTPRVSLDELACPSCGDSGAIRKAFEIPFGEDDAGRLHYDAANPRRSFLRCIPREGGCGHELTKGEALAAVLDTV